MEKPLRRSQRTGTLVDDFQAAGVPTWLIIYTVPSTEEPPGYDAVRYDLIDTRQGSSGVIGGGMVLGAPPSEHEPRSYGVGVEALLQGLFDRLDHIMQFMPTPFQPPKPHPSNCVGYTSQEECSIPMHMLTGHGGKGLMTKLHNRI